MKTAWDIECDRIYGLMESHTEPYEVDYMGLGITVFPNVFSPKYFNDSIWLAEQIPMIVKRRSLLEIGSGCGVVSLAARLQGASVTATDINPDAVLNSKQNFSRHSQNIPIYEGDMFEPLPEGVKYDFIFWNHPFNDTKEKKSDMLWRAGYDPNYGGLERYMKDAYKFLNPEGVVLLGTGSNANLARVRAISRSHGYSMHLIRKKDIPHTKGSALENDFRIYRFLHEEH